MGFQNAEVGLFIDLTIQQWLQLVCKDILNGNGKTIKESLCRVETDDPGVEFESKIGESTLKYILHNDIMMISDEGTCREFEAEGSDGFYDIVINCEFKRGNLQVRFNHCDFSGISLANVGDGESKSFKKDDIDTLFEWVDYVKSCGRLPNSEYTNLTLLTSFEYSNFNS